AMMVDPIGIVLEIVRWGSSCGATALTEAEVTRVLLSKRQVAGVEVDLAGRSRRYFAPVVLNCAGPWSPEVVAAAGEPSGVFHPTLAFNLLIDRPAPATTSEAVGSRETAGRSYFEVPLGDQT